MSASAGPAAWAQARPAAAQSPASAPSPARANAPGAATSARGATTTPATTPAAAAGDEGASPGRSSAELEALLSRLRTDNPTVRREAVDQLLALDDDDVPAVRARLLSPLGTDPNVVHARMVRAIANVTGGRPNAEYDLLDALLGAPRGPEIDVAIERVVLARALGRIRTADAGRALVAFALGQRIFRMESMRVIRGQMREYVVPALIEIRLPSEDTRLFIRQVREAIRRVTPGDSVQTRDNALLAEILRAFGATRQIDAVNVVVSFVNSDRVQVRDAARWAVTQYGRESINAMRTAYENTVGEDPNPQWGWERTARELYEAYDRRRAEEVQSAMDEGLAAAGAHRYSEMMSRFQFVLARHPLFDRRAEMVPHLLAYARSLERTDAARAEPVYRLALRIDPEGAHHTAIQSAIQFIEAERALARGVADPELYRAALRTDPNNARARAQLDAVAQAEVLRARKRSRTLVAIGLLALSLAGVGLLVMRARENERTPA